MSLALSSLWWVVKLSNSTTASTIAPTSTTSTIYLSSNKRHRPSVTLRRWPRSQTWFASTEVATLTTRSSGSRSARHPTAICPTVDPSMMPSLLAGTAWSNSSKCSTKELQRFRDQDGAGSSTISRRARSHSVPQLTRPTSRMLVQLLSPSSTSTFGSTHITSTTETNALSTCRTCGRLSTGRRLRNAISLL